MRKYALTLTLLYCILSATFAQGDGDGKPAIRIKGFVDTYHAIRTEKSNDWMSSRSRVRGELTLEKGNAGMFVSMNAVYNSILNNQSGLYLREAYAYYTPESWDIRAGRQIITWGVADAMRLTDIISPMDYTEFLAQDYDDIRIPVNGLRLRYIRPKWSMEAVIIPVSSFYELTVDKDNPWAISLPGVGLPYTINLGRKPGQTLTNIEYGGRIGFYLSGVDFSVSALQTWNKMPVFRKRIGQNGNLLCEGEYARMTMLGTDLSVPIGKFVIRAEMAEYFNEAQEPVVGGDVRRCNSTNALVGIDFYPGNDWTLGVQYFHKYINRCDSSISSYRNAGISTLRISKDLLHNTLNISTFAYIDVSNGAIYNRLSADYAITDQIHAMLGYDLFHADAGMFAMYKQNSEMWMKLKYSF